jgi:hypothetical protein
LFFGQYALSSVLDKISLIMDKLSADGIQYPDFKNIDIIGPSWTLSEISQITCTSQLRPITDRIMNPTISIDDETMVLRQNTASEGVDHSINETSDNGGSLDMVDKLDETSMSTKGITSNIELEPFGNQYLLEAQLVILREAMNIKYKWDCKHCTFKNLGLETLCEICKKYNQSPQPDWQCNTCYNLNKNSKLTCFSCYSIREWQNE